MKIRMPSIVPRAAIGFGLGIAGIIYVIRMPKAQKISPTEIRAPAYSLIDADRDGDVDKIIDQRNPQNPIIYVAPNIVEWFKNNGQTFIDYMGTPQAPSLKLQEVANFVLRGEADSRSLEQELELELNKRR